MPKQVRFKKPSSMLQTMFGNNGSGEDDDQYTDEDSRSWIGDSMNTWETDQTNDTYDDDDGKQVRFKKASSMLQRIFGTNDNYDKDDDTFSDKDDDGDSLSWSSDDHHHDTFDTFDTEESVLSAEQRKHERRRRSWIKNIKKGDKYKTLQDNDKYRTLQDKDKYRTLQDKESWLSNSNTWDTQSTRNTLESQYTYETSSTTSSGFVHSFEDVAANFNILEWAGLSCGADTTCSKPDTFEG